MTEGLQLPKNEPKEESEGEPDELTTNPQGLCALPYIPPSFMSAE